MPRDGGGVIKERTSPPGEAVRRLILPLLAAISCLVASGPVSGEVVEDVLAWVNGDVITLSEYREEERLMEQEVQRRYSGEERDKELRDRREALLLQLIDRKILVHYAEHYSRDLSDMADSLYDDFRERQKIETEEELEKMLRQEGMTPEDLKRQLIEMYAPAEVVRYEVSSRISVGDREVQARYEADPSPFHVPAQATVREIVLLAEDDAAKQARRSEAEAVRARLLAGEPFAEVAKEVSEAGTADEGGLLGTFQKGELSPAVEEMAFGLPVGQVSEVREASYGFHIVMVEERKEAYVRSLDEVREELRDRIEEERFATDLESFLLKARAASNWCVKPRYESLLSIPPPETCGPLQKM
jgi:parvulin-like peptidyl-prolyl isomerase